MSDKLTEEQSLIKERLQLFFGRAQAKAVDWLIYGQPDAFDLDAPLESIYRRMVRTAAKAACVAVKEADA